VTVDNPYWDAVREQVKVGYLFGETRQVMRWDLSGDRIDFEKYPDRHDFVGKYSWTVTDPDSVAFVARHAHNGLVDPMAGTGYWAYVLRQVGVDCACYDLRPRENPWHDGEALWVEVEKMDGAEAVLKHADRTLLLAWPPYSEPAGERVLHAYQGERVIYIGESASGCTGDEAMHDALEDEWEEVDEAVPVQWEGLHDRITVYARRPDEVAARLVSERKLHQEAEWDDEVPRADELAGDLVPVLQTGGTE